MSQEKPKRRWYQFSLRTMFVAVICFAVAFTAWSASLHNSLYGRGEVRLDLAAIAGAGIGSGIGVLLGRFWRGLLIGAIALVALELMLNPAARL